MAILVFVPLREKRRARSELVLKKQNRYARKQVAPPERREALLRLNLFSGRELPKSKKKKSPWSHIMKSDAPGKTLTLTFLRKERMVVFYAPNGRTRFRFSPTDTVFPHLGNGEKKGNPVRFAFGEEINRREYLCFRR